MEGLGGVVFMLLMGVAWLLSQFMEHKGKRGPPVERARTVENEAPRHEQRRQEQPEQEQQEQTQQEQTQQEQEQRRSDAAQAARAYARMRRSEQLAASREERALAIRLAAASVRRSPARQLFTGRANLRRAVIAMTVLGPPVSEQPRSAAPGEGAPPKRGAG